MTWGGGKSPVLTPKDKKFIDMILSGKDKFEAYQKVYPDRVKDRTRKQINKSIKDLLEKPKCKEYKETLEQKAQEAYDKEVEKKARSIVHGVLSEEEIFLKYSEIASNEDNKAADRLKALDSLCRYKYQLDKRQLDLQGELQQVVIIDDYNLEEDTNNETSDDEYNTTS